MPGKSRNSDFPIGFGVRGSNSLKRPSRALNIPGNPSTNDDGAHQCAYDAELLHIRYLVAIVRPPIEARTGDHCIMRFKTCTRTIVCITTLTDLFGK